MKFPARWKFDELKQRLVLTREEKRVIVFILAAFVLGLAVEHYRAAHPQPPPSIDTKHPHSRGYRALPSPSTSPKGIRKPRKKNPTASPPPSEG